MFLVHVEPFGLKARATSAALRSRLRSLRECEHSCDRRGAVRTLSDSGMALVGSLKRRGFDADVRSCAPSSVPVNGVETRDSEGVSTSGVLGLPRFNAKYEASGSLTSPRLERKDLEVDML